MNGLMEINEVHIHLGRVETVYEHLRGRGRLGVEGVALWAGTHENKIFTVSHTIIPGQTGHKTEDGLLYTVSGEELHKMNVELYKNKLSLIAQIHSHPGEAYHSGTDDRYPIVTVNGGLSIVVPDFGFNDFSLLEWAVYRLVPEKGWIYLETERVKKMIKIF